MSDTLESYRSRLHDSWMTSFLSYRKTILTIYEAGRAAAVLKSGLVRVRSRFLPVFGKSVTIISHANTDSRSHMTTYRKTLV